MGSVRTRCKPRKGRQALAQLVKDEARIKLHALSANSLHCQLSRIRAQVNREFALTLHDREMANAGYFERLCGQLESAGDDSEAAKA